MKLKFTPLRLLMQAPMVSPDGHRTDSLSSKKHRSGLLRTHS